MAQRNPSAITTTRTVDPTLVQGPTFTMDADDRQYIDNQIRGCEQQLVSCVIGGALCTYVQVDAGSSALAVGDIVCLAGSTIGLPTLTKALAASLAAALSAFGVVINAASPGAVALVAVVGAVSPTTTGLAATSGGVRVNTTTGRCERVASFTAGDYVLGTCDAQGYLSLATGYAYPAAGGGGAPALPVTRTVRSTAVPSQITTADDLVRATAALATQTLPAAPSDGHTYEVCNDTSGNNDVNGGGHNINATGAATMTLGPRQSVTFTYCLAGLVWLAS